MDIKVENITKIFGNQKAVDDVSFTIKTGEILGFLGPNGAGKTTTMKAITGYMLPNKGDVKIGGLSISENADKLKSKIGYLSEQNPLYLDMPLIDYLKFMAELNGVAKKNIDDRVKDMIVLCGLTAERHKNINELSKGYKQRVGLAQALIHDPEILILDEPTTGLDPNQIIEIRDLIRRIGKEKTVILSSHILAEVEATCDRILIINNGKIVADGTSEQLRKQSQGREILKVTIEDGDVNEIYNSIRDLSSVGLVDFISKSGTFEIQSRPNMTSKRDIFKLCVDKNWVLTELTSTDTKLEDVFRELTLN